MRHFFALSVIIIQYDIIEYSICEHSYNKNPDLFWLQSIKDLEKLDYVKCSEIPEKNYEIFLTI